MPWPTSNDYFESNQNPKTCFADPELRTGTVAANAMGLPIARTGNFADVYQVNCPNNRSYAVKCFTKEVPDLQKRYKAISDHLKQAKQEGGLAFMVEFDYLDPGIRVANRWFPVLKMRWVEGQFLNEFVGK